MSGVLMIVLYVLVASGTPKVESKVFKTEEACMKAASNRISELEQDPRYFLITAGCFGPIPAQEAKK